MQKLIFHAKIGNRDNMIWIYERHAISHIYRQTMRCYSLALWRKQPMMQQDHAVSETTWMYIWWTGSAFFPQFHPTPSQYHPHTAPGCLVPIEPCLGAKPSTCHVSLKPILSLSGPVTQESNKGCWYLTLFKCWNSIRSEFSGSKIRIMTMIPTVEITRRHR